MKRIITLFIKAVFAGTLAFVFLNVICLIYYNVPNRVNDSLSVVDYKWPSNAFFSKWTEGVAWGTTNNDGFNNIKDYTENTNIDILLMGSSHTEGFNVGNNATIASIMNKSIPLMTYSIGISEHTLLQCIKNLDNALTKYKPKQYVVIETMKIDFNENTINNMLNGDLKKLTSLDDSTISFLQNFKYLKLVYYQLENLQKNNNRTIEIVNDVNSLSALMSFVSNICLKHGVKCIIVYHPTLEIDNNGNISVNTNKENLKIFEQACKNNEISFINMEDIFVENYKERYILPHGFNNTIPGKGHLNKYGHEMIANALIKEITGDKQ